jgi:hypothetical protein
MAPGLESGEYLGVDLQEGGGQQLLLLRAAAVQPAPRPESCQRQQLFHRLQPGRKPTKHQDV